MPKIPYGKYTKEFREEAVKLVIVHGHSIDEAAHRRTRETYGPERLREDLAANGIDVGVHRIKRIRKKLGLKCKQWIILTIKKSVHFYLTTSKSIFQKHSLKWSLLEFLIVPILLLSVAIKHDLNLGSQCFRSVPK